MKDAAVLAAKALELWRIGRPKPINPSVLRDSGVITSKFLDQADALADQTGWNPARFLDEVDAGGIPRFREDKKEALREYLEEQGYLPADRPLPEEEVEVRLKAVISSLKHLDREEARQTVMRILG